MNDWNRQIIEEFRANEGRVGGMFEGAPMLILHSVGAKTAQERVNPLMHRKDGERLVIFASKGGAPSHPDWFWNLVANPGAEVEVGTRTIRVEARMAEGEERERLWSAQKSEYPQFAGYEANTKREIPVIVLEPIAGDVAA